MMLPTVDVSHREESGRALDLGLPVLTVLGALFVGAIPLLALGTDPLAFYWTMLVSSPSSSNGSLRVLVKLVPLVLAGLTVYLPLKCGLINIGAEGQIYMGGIAATWAAMNVSGSSLVVLGSMVGCGMLAGGFWAAIPAYLRSKWDVNEIIVTVFMTFIAIQLNEYMIRGPLQGRTGFPSSPLFSEAAILPTVMGDTLHVGIISVPIAVAIAYLLLNRTQTGYEIRLMGSNPDAAEQAGVSKLRIFMLTMILGGLFSGLAGMIEVSAIQNKLISNFSPRYGFTAIPIALLGQNGAVRVAFAALFFAVLSVGGTDAAATYGVSNSIIDFIEASVILFLIAAEFFRRYRVDVRLRSATATGGGV